MHQRGSARIRCEVARCGAAHGERKRHSAGGPACGPARSRTGRCTRNRTNRATGTGRESTNDRRKLPSPLAERCAGLGASAGVVEGTARVVDSPEQFDQVQKGELLDLQDDEPGLGRALHEDRRSRDGLGAAHFPHPAVVSREFGIPAVVGTRTATQTIKTGQRASRRRRSRDCGGPAAERDRSRLDRVCGDAFVAILRAEPRGWNPERYSISFSLFRTICALLGPIRKSSFCGVGERFETFVECCRIPPRLSRSPGDRSRRASGRVARLPVLSVASNGS